MSVIKEYVEASHKKRDLAGRGKEGRNERKRLKRKGILWVFWGGSSGTGTHVHTPPQKHTAWYSRGQKESTLD